MARRKESCPDLGEKFFRVVSGGEEGLDSLVDGMQGVLERESKADGLYIAEGSYTISPGDDQGYCGML